VNLSDLLIFAIPVLLLLFLFQSQRKRQRTFSTLQDRLQPGQEVLTTSGLYGRIISLDERVIVLETGPGQTVRWDRRAIASVVPDDQTTTDGLPDAPPPTAPEADGPDAPNEK
jgi:preprotein translocase subunit YajC